MAIATQFYLLQYKSWKLQFRKKLVTAFEFLIPVFLCILMVLIRSIVEVNEYPEPKYFPSYPIKEYDEGLIFVMNPLSVQTGLTPYMPLAYTPKTNYTDQIMGRVEQYMTGSYIFGPNLPPMYYAPVVGFESEEKLIETLNFNNDTVDNEATFVGGVVFDNPDEYINRIPNNISFTIRCRYNLRTTGSVGQEWNTRLVYPTLVVPGPNGDNFSDTPNYYDEGFLQIQHAVQMSVIDILNPSANISQYETAMQRFPYPPYTDDLFLLIIQWNFSFFIMLCFIFFSLNIPKEVTLEKEKKLKESMRMMGMANWLQWTSAFVKYFIFLFIITFLMTFLLCPPYNSSPSFTVLTNSNFLVIWLFFLLYAISVICFCFNISVIFNQANAAAAAGGILFFISYIPFSFVSPRYDTMSRGIKLLASLDLNVAMSLGMIVIGRYEGTEGVQWGNLHEPVSIDDNLSLADIMVMLVVDSIIHLILMWYIEAVFPGSYGIPQPPYFFVLPSYWCGTKPSTDDSRERSRGSQIQKNSDFFEEEPVNSVAGISIKGLTKQFKANGKKKTAVNDLSLNMYDGQITALLGHNGAGKTTTMFMLTGFMPPTSGTALVNGYDIRKDITNVRSSLGLCPQHDILFDNLTVEEHLYFFAKLKRCPDDKIKTEIDYYVKTLGIEEKRKAFSSTLSGGQKRKLSVGIALIGDSKIVILDEPTSGMDPSARRHMWDVLQAQRAGRTMILTTHFMDEADHLGDRIAIMADGVVQCCGSSLFLKKKYGAGYHMVMTKKTDCDVDKVDELLTKHVPEAKLESNVGAELSYVLPDDKVSAFPQMFAELEERKDPLGILGFGASVTTMEEVFMKVGEGQVTEDEDTIESISGRNNGATSSAEEISLVDLNVQASTSARVVHDVTKNTGFKLFSQQFKAMFYKRVLYTIRNKTLTISQLLLPLIFTALTVLILKTSPLDDGTAERRDLNLQMFKTSESIYSTDPVSPFNGSVAQALVDEFDSLQLHTLVEVDEPKQKILDIADDSLRRYNYETILGADYNSTRNNESTITLLFNPVPIHAAATALLYSDQALLHHFVNDSYSFAAANHPLPQSSKAEIQTVANNIFSADSFSYSSNLMFGFAFLTASFVFFLITERSRKVKHSQIVSGVKWYNFWLSTFTWDFINYMIPALAVMTLFAICGIKNFADISNGNMQPLYLFVLMVLFGLAFLPNMYAMQFIFSGPATGYVVLVFFNLLTGIFPQLVISILMSIESSRDVAKVFDWIFIILLPNYNMGQGMGNIFTNYDYLELCLTQFPNGSTVGDEEPPSLDTLCKTIKDIGGEFPCCKDSCGETCLDFQENYFAWESLGIGRSLVFLAIQAVVFWLIVIVIETEVLMKLFYLVRPKVLVTPEFDGVRDDDVTAEKERILLNSEQKNLEDSQVLITGLTKYFANHKAVDDIYLSVPQGECFGLLGVNGAGKTTTFRMLTGDETISGGTAYMAGKNVRTDIHDVQKSIGYCPQFDALIDQMTGEEMLYMYARLRGIPEKSIPPIVDDLLTALLLNKHKKKPTKDYSGGNKRKLSTAIALMGNPPIVFLDEPTTGMDPVARRMLWGTLTKVRDSGKTLILTSHSMEECEALCTRMAIMVNGKYRCLGSTQHLKNKFGAGYTLIARVSYPEDGSMPDVQAVQNFVEENFAGSVLKDKHQNLVQYHIARGELTWAVVFDKLEQNKAALHIEDYSVSQTTLEQVFINFARAQVEPDEAKPGCTKRFRQTCCACCIPEYIVDQQREPTAAVSS